MDVDRGVLLTALVTCPAVATLALAPGVRVEVTFKAVARALRQAFKREGGELPTTKGQL